MKMCENEGCESTINPDRNTNTRFCDKCRVSRKNAAKKARNAARYNGAKSANPSPAAMEARAPAFNKPKATKVPILPHPNVAWRTVPKSEWGKILPTITPPDQIPRWHFAPGA